MSKQSEPTPEAGRKRGIRGLFSFMQKSQRLEDAAESRLDEALKSLTRALDVNAAVVREVKRRQSSGSLKIVSVPPAGVFHDAE
jgi:hypothetical protein